MHSIDYTIYVDMDGVLVDFDKSFKTLGYGTRSEVSKDSLFDIINKEDAYFWANMEWMPDGRMLWDKIKQYSPIILSRPSGSNACIEGKISWIYRNISMQQHIILKKEKYEYADSDSILIDDDVLNINPWKRHEGKGILHINSIYTLNELQSILKEDK